jgi:hypothetical protein
VAGYPLRPATDLRLGRLLPHQLANRTQAPPQASCDFSPPPCGDGPHAVLASVSRSYPPLRGRLPTYYSPVCHYLSLAGLTVRLACIKHAASVYPEPGSNSPINYGINLACLTLLFAMQLLKCKFFGQNSEYQIRAELVKQRPVVF